MFILKKLMLNNEIKKKTIRQKIKGDVGPDQLLKPVTRGYKTGNTIHEKQ
jgi:hypothetical protein